MFSDVLALLDSGRFVDLLLPGWMDRDGPIPVHRPLSFEACLQAETGLIQFTAVNNNGGLHIRLVDRVSFGPEAEDVFDDELAVASVGAHFLLSSTPLYCTRLRLFTNNESVPGESIFRAAEFTFGDSYSVFFDPLWIDGIRLSTGIPELWLAEENSPRNQSSFGPLEETEWLPTRLRPEASR